MSLRAILMLLVPAALWLAGPAAAADDAAVDTALIVSVDVSGSVDENRYELQMDGIAKAIEDPGVIASILGGPHGAIMFTMVEWSERPATAIPWVRIASRADAKALADRIRQAPRQEGEFTCVAHMMTFVSDLTLPLLPVKAKRVVMDVSGDGVDNCDGDEATAEMRDSLVARGMTINGLPINENEPDRPVGAGAFRAPGRPFQQRTLTSEIKTLEPWYREHVIGGDGAFLFPAQGYKDFARAMREKFAVEISGRSPTGMSRMVDAGLLGLPRRE
jgi:hypothetical protein